MIVFALIDEHGLPTGGGSRRVLPEGAVALSPPYTLADLPRLRLRDGVWEERDDLLPKPEPSAEEMEAARAAHLVREKAEAVDRINLRAGEMRKRIYTDIPGQAALYLEKRTEAVAYVRAAHDDGEPSTLADFPLLESETGLTAPSAWQLAQLWLNRSAQFKRVGAATERLRMRALIHVDAAPDIPAIEAIEAEFSEALAGLPL